ncbi:MAG: ABC transporter ATP-binding protein [Dehalococcoidales bacterium]|nr:ABC transporter ATP-binding protein [Dehalococcoidales bacterium]
MTRLLEVKGLTKKFGGVVAVNDLNFHVDDGEILGLMGPNGAGKTTTFNLIMGDYKPDTGQISFKGQDIGSLETYQRVKMGIARTYQIPRPYHDLPVIEDLRISTVPDSITKCLRGKKKNIEEVEQIGIGVGLKDRLMKYPHELSLGDLRRVELAKAIATDPKLIMLDEIFAGLTVHEINELTELLMEKKKAGLVFIVVSHDLKALAAVIDRAVVIQFGHLIAEGTYEEVAHDTKVKKAYFGM